MLDRVGQHVGNYRLLRLVGQGGFAQVYLGEHRYLKSAAAFKMLRLSLSEKEAKRFLEEAQTLVRLRHASIVRVLDFTMERGTPVLIMDYVSGGTLRQRHPRGTCLSPAMTVDYVKQVAAALQYAHNQHIIHRDVKPENILLDANLRLVLSDFGLSLFAPSPDLLSTQELAGTLAYTAPEQLRGKPCFASDQYALGIITYEWLCGSRPFEGMAWEMLNQHLSVVPPSLREHRPELPAAVEQVVLKALAKNPQDRYVSVSAFAQALERTCRESSTQDDDDSQVTASLRAVSSAISLRPSRSDVRTVGAVFLSAAPADQAFVARLAADLKRRGILLSNELAEPASNQEDAMRQAMRAAHLVVVVVTPQTRSSRQVKEQLRFAQMYQRRLVLAWMQGDQVAAMLLNSTWEQMLPADVIDARGSRYQAALNELLVCLQDETPVSPLEETTLSTILEEPRNPYKGLRAFRQDDTADFFGRDALIESLVQTIKGALVSEPSGTSNVRLLSVMGPSGSGKSSIVLAGLLPQLQNGAVPGGSEWIYVEPIVPGKYPLEALVLALTPHFPARSAKTLRDDLEEDSARGLHLLATQLVKRAGQKVVLVIDQFEEVFTQTSSEQERRRFFDLLVTAVTEPQGPLLVILTLRADFYEQAMHYPDLYRLIEDFHTSVLSMHIHELRSVIEEPAALPDVQLTFEGNLVGDLLFEAQGQVGALPLLEFTLDQLFQQRDGRSLTMTAYQRIGGVKGALAKQAESTYAALPSEEHRHFARSLFLRLIDPGRSEQDTTRRRAALSELSLPDAQQTIILREVADAFVAARLLTTNETAGSTTIEVSHEALIREWGRLSDWLREGREDIHLQQAVSQDVTEWEQRGRSKDRLYRGSQLKEARAWASRNTPSGQEVTFLRASAQHQLRSRVGVTTLVLLLVLVLGLIVPITQLGLFSDPTRVTNLNDAGPGSLRQAIDTAPADRTITFDSHLRGGTIMLTSGPLTFDKSLTVRGLGANSLAISSGTHGYNVHVSRGISVSITGLAFKNSITTEEKGSFLANEGRLTLTNSVISGNIAAFGGGIYTQGALTLINSAVSGNTATTASGGGIYNTAQGSVMLINSTVSGNRALNAAGGIFGNLDGTIVLINSTVSGNTATTLSGGGIYAADNTILTVINSTVSGNRAFNRGGGIFNYGSTTEITFSTIYDNTVANQGGGILVAADSVTASQEANDVKLSNSIVAGNHALNGPNIGGTLTSGGYNLLQNPSGATFTANTQHSTDVLVDLHANSGIDPVLSGKPLQTHALLPGSPALDRIPLSACSVTTYSEDFLLRRHTITTDQRGVQRPSGNETMCDIGAYEYVPAG